MVPVHNPRHGRGLRARLGGLLSAGVEALRRLDLPHRLLHRDARPGPTSEIARRADELAGPPPRGVDLVLLATTFALLGLGLVMVYSASAVFAKAHYGSSFFFLQRDIVYIAAGLGALYCGWRIAYPIYERASYAILLLALLALAAVLIPGLGTRVDGAVRWFRIAGVSIQPSEPAKFALVVYLAHSLAKKRAEVRSFSIGFLPHLAVAGVFAMLLLLQPDLGTAAIVMGVSMLLLLVAGTKITYVVLALLAAFPVAYQQIVGTPWRLRRLLAFLDPWAYRQDAGYQVAESLISVGTGGIAGVGLGDGRQKLFFLPAAHTDFLLAIIGEELGFVGLCTVVALFSVLAWRGLRAALGARDLFGTYLAFGITALISLQALLHMAVVLGLVPTKGITLPLVSFGGSALVTNCFLVGVLLRVAARDPAPAGEEPAPDKPWATNRRKSVRVVVARGDRGVPA